MSIDADLNAGMISEKEARERREKVSREADFYGAMDGATKFVKGDAIAGIIIVINQPYFWNYYWNDAIGYTLQMQQPIFHINSG